MPKSSKSKSSETCECKTNYGYLVVAWILGAIGLWALVGGFATQFNSATPTSADSSVLAWYFAGLLLIGLAKVCKWKTWCRCGSCCK